MNEVARKGDFLMKKLLLIDGNSVLYRAFYGVTLLTTSKGVYTNAVYGFAMMIMQLLQDEQPSHVLVAFDKGKATFRHQEYAEYKGKRQETPSEMLGQFQMARDLLGAFSVQYLDDERYEADDIIGIYAEHAKQLDDVEVTVITGDKDLLQLVSPKVTTCLTRKGITDLERYTPEKVVERYSLTPEQIVDLKGLMGDASDNIPGVPGVGEKTAIKLLTQYPSVEEVLLHAGEVNGAKLREKLETYKDQALLSKRLATILREGEMALTFDELAFTGYDVDRLREAFRGLEFKSLAERIKPYRGSEVASEETVTDALALAADSKMLGADQLKQCLAAITTPVVMLLAMEGNYQTGTLRGMVLACDEDTYFIPYDESPSSKASWQEIATWLQAKNVTKVVYDSKAWMVRLAQEGVIAKASSCFSDVVDLLLATYLLHTSDGEPTLLDVVTAFDPDFIVTESLVTAIEKHTHDYTAALATIARRLVQSWSSLAEQLKAMNLEELYEKMELPLAKVLADMEAYGVRLDVDRLTTIGKELTEKIDTLTQQIYALAGVTFNINSTKQLGEILFDKLGLPPVKKTKTGYSTSADVLEKLAPHSEIVTYILTYRQLSKLQSTYIEGLLRVVRQPALRVHTSFHQAMTATGRLSSADPNLQNIPIRLEEGRRLRQAFIPTHPDWLMLSADYSQVELRILAHLCQDKALVEAFLHDMDIHTRTASDVFEVEPEQVTSLMRRQAKAVNFGIIYGISDFGLSQNLNISRAEAGRFIEQYFEKFPGVKGYMDRSIEDARSHGYAETVMGRRRYLPGIASRNFNERSFAERTAMNTPIQGTAADIIKVAMIQIARALKEQNLQSKMLLQVHDELIFECPKEEMATMKNLVREKMEGAIELSVPLRVDIHEGPTWYEAK